MSFSDDHSSPATPFDGETNDIFGDSDMISASQTTTERVVDTQSGYLVVLRKTDGSRVALSVKRRIGTPPGTSIVLTPDEQVKMAKILAEARVHVNQTARVSPRSEQWTSNLSRKTREGGDDSFLDGSPEKEFARVAQDREPEFDGQEHSPIKQKLASINKIQLIGVAAAMFIVPALVAVVLKVAAPKPSAEPPKTALVSPLVIEEGRIDHFVRGFVADMLDFDATSYKMSQIRAMSSMTPELLERYWKETNFPLSKSQLSATPKGQTLIITKVNQTAEPDHTHSVDLFAELASSNSKISTPVHLLLKVGTGPDNQLRVIEQKDLSGK